MEPKFKVGDKVRILETAKNHSWFSLLGMSQFIGDIDTIKLIENNSSQYATDKHMYRLTNTEFWWDASMFELVEAAEEKEPESEYNIGDVVEILPRIHDSNDYTNGYTDHMCCFAGGKYTITDKYKCQYKGGKIKDDGFVYRLSETGVWNWSSSMFKKAEQGKFSKTKKPTEKLEPAVGEVFDYEGKSYVCIESNMGWDETCRNCSFRKVPCNFITCTRNRKDQKDVYFQEILDTPFVSSDYLEQHCGISTNAISTHPLHSIGLGLTLSPVPWIDVEDKKDSGKSIIEYIMGLNKKPNYKLKFKL